MSRHWSRSTVTTSRPWLFSSANSRYRVGKTIRPLSSRVTFAAPRNMDGQAAYAHFSPLFPTWRHYRNAAGRGQEISHKFFSPRQRLTPDLARGGDAQRKIGAYRSVGCRG